MWMGSVPTLRGSLAASVLILDTMSRLKPITQRFTGKGDMLAQLLKGILKAKRVRKRSLEERVKVQMIRMGKYLSNLGHPSPIHQAHTMPGLIPHITCNPMEEHLQLLHKATLLL